MYTSFDWFSLPFSCFHLSHTYVCIYTHVHKYDHHHHDHHQDHHLVEEKKGERDFHFHSAAKKKNNTYDMETNKEKNAKGMESKLIKKRKLVTTVCSGMWYMYVYGCM